MNPIIKIFMDMYDDNRRKYFENLAERFRGLVTEEKLYTDCHFSLDSAAGRLGESRHNVSHAINQYLKTDFLSFVNELRLTEAKILMKEPENAGLTIDEIGRKAGFSVRTSFFRVSKKITGCTPSELRSKPINK